MRCIVKFTSKNQLPAEVGLLEVRAIRRISLPDAPKNKMVLLVVSDTVDTEHSIVYASNSNYWNDEQIYRQVCNRLYDEGVADLANLGEFFRLLPETIKMWNLTELL